MKTLTYSPNTDMVQDVRLTYSGTALVEGKDYTVSYVNNTKAGAARITFTGKGLYNGTFTKTFRINRVVLSDTMLDEGSKSIKVKYTGRAVRPEITLNNGDTELQKDTDYIVAYTNNIKVSTDVRPAQIIVRGKGNYTGSFRVNFAVIDEDNDNTGKSDAKGIKPDAEEPTEDEPVTDEPTADETVTDEPATDEPVTDEPTEEGPATDEPTEGEPATDKATEDNPVTDEPTEELVIDESTREESVTYELTVDVSATD